VAAATSKEPAARPQSAAALAASLRAIGTILDVRAGDAPRRELLPIDDEPASRWWVPLLILLLVVVAAWWYFAR
jgi:hypothetical protein